MCWACFSSLFFVLAFAPPAHAGIGCALNDEFDDVDVVREVQKVDARVKALKAELEVTRKQLLRLKERDFMALFGGKLDKPAKTYALPCFEIRGLTLSGLGPLDPEEDHAHADFHQVSDFAGLEVWYGSDGETPVVAIFYFKVDHEFTALEAAGELEKRLVWDRLRWEFLNAWLECRMAQVFPYEVDVAAMWKLYSGEESLDVRERLQAWITAGEGLGLTLKKSTHRGNGTVIYRWLRSDGTLARQAYHGLGYEGADVPPSHFYHYHHNADGKYFPHRERYLAWGNEAISSWRWMRPEDTVIQGHGRQASALPFPDSWSWLDERNEMIRYESDDNGDAIPDWVAEKFDMEGKGRRPLELDESWAIHPELVPEIARLSGDFQPRLIIRPKPEPPPLAPPPWKGREAAGRVPPGDVPRGDSPAGETAEEGGAARLLALGSAAAALALAALVLTAWRWLKPGRR